MTKKRTKNYQYVTFLVSEEGDNNSFLVFNSKDLQVTHILYNLRSIAKLSLKQLIHHRECLVKPVFFASLLLGKKASLIEELPSNDMLCI